MTLFKTTLAALSTLVATPALAHAQESWNGGYGHMMGGGSFGVFSGLISLILLAVLVVAGIAGVRWLMENGKETPRRRDALEILKERLAKGEIDPEEYQARRKVLEDS